MTLNFICYYYLVITIALQTLSSSFTREQKYDKASGGEGDEKLIELELEHSPCEIKRVDDKLILTIDKSKGKNRRDKREIHEWIFDRTLELRVYPAIYKKIVVKPAFHEIVVIIKMVLISNLEFFQSVLGF